MESGMRSPLCGCMSRVVNGLVSRKQQRNGLLPKLLWVKHAKSVDGATRADLGQLCPGTRTKAWQCRS